MGLHEEELPDRITPACAGKSNFCTILGKMVEDHPRVCGEKYVPYH